MKKRKILLVVCVILVFAGLIYGAGKIILNSASEQGTQESGDAVYTQSVASLLGIENSLGVTNRYTGVVEAQRSEDIIADSSRKVKEILVKEGDAVEEGTPLFIYDVSEDELVLEQSKLELERLENSVETLNDEIKELEREREKAASSDKLEYTMEIQSKQLDIKQAEYDILVKEAEIAQQEAAVEDTTVYSPMEGIVQSINENSGQESSYESYGGGDDSALMKILSTGMFRVKCKVSEQNIWDLTQGEPVIVRSRISDDVWTGTIDEINTSGTDENNNNMTYYYGDDTASQYAFYVGLDDSDGMMMGQHVYVELDLGQNTEREGIWLSSDFIVIEEDQMYVLAEDAGMLVQKQIEVGIYDEMMDQYQILSGLTEEDWIAYPMDGVEEGMKATRQTQYADTEDEQ